MSYRKRIFMLSSITRNSKSIKFQHEFYQNQYETILFCFFWYRYFVFHKISIKLFFLFGFALFLCSKLEWIFSKLARRPSSFVFGLAIFFPEISIDFLKISMNYFLFFVSLATFFSLKSIVDFLKISINFLTIGIKPFRKLA